MGPDLTTAIVVGAVVGLFFVALGHAQLVWLARRKRAPGATRRGPVPTLLGWAAALGAALAFGRALVARGLPERPALLAGDGLLAVRPRPGLVAVHAVRSATFTRGEPLLRFSGQDGQEARAALRTRRQQVADQLANERMRPLDLDGETLRRAEAARAAVRDHEQRVAQLVSERDGIEREVTSQRLALESRRYGIEGDDRDAARELEPLAAALATERGALAGQESLAARGLIAPLDAARTRDAVAKLEGRVRQLQDRRGLLSRELAELSSLRALARATLERQLAARAAELQSEQEQGARAERDLADATAALERDRPRAEAERRRRLEELEGQLADCDALLDGRVALVVAAPWDGRVGYRDPTPEVAPPDGGPLLVAYRPGAIAAVVRLDPGEAEAARAGLEARVVVPVAGAPEDRGVDRELELEGRIVGRAALADGAVELRVACDPPDRVVRRLAMGGGVTVGARLRRGLLHVRSFQLGLGLAVVALALAAWRPVRAAALGRRGGDRGGRGGDGGVGGEGIDAAAPAWASPPGTRAWPPAPSLPPAAAAQSAEAGAGAPS